MTDKVPFTSNLLHPKHWPVWCFMALARLVVWLPFSWRIALGRGMGILLHKIAGSRRHIAEVNIRLCFPEKSADEQAKLVRQIFIDNGIGFIETMMAWFLPPERLAQRTEFINFHKITDHLAQGQGVLLLGAHYSTLDLAGALVTTQVPLNVSYRPQDNAVMNFLMERNRGRLFEQCLQRKDIRGFIRTLKQGQVLWYAQDQDYGRKNSVFVNFFGVPAATITATSRIAKAGKAVVVPLSYFRKADNSGYLIEAHDSLPIPSGDDVADAQMANDFLEQQLRRYPSQYLWLHKRFKTHPDESLGPRFHYRRNQ